MLLKMVLFVTVVTEGAQSRVEGTGGFGAWVLAGG